MRQASPFSDSSQSFDDVGRPSKSELKRQMHDLQALGEDLSELPASRLPPLQLPERLLDALDEFHRTRSHEGRRRQMQYIGKLMRFVDPAPIREAVAAYRLGSAKDTLMLHDAERWRDALLAEDSAITRWINAHPDHTEPQTLRSLVRAARKDLQSDKPELRHGRPYRELFQIVKSALAAETNAADDQPETDDDAA
jgi:ribosome-associated protein